MAQISGAEALMLCLGREWASCDEAESRRKDADRNLRPD
jgi:hypothetical protein